MVVDGTVELVHLDGTTNQCTAPDLGLDKGPMSVPLAIEKARTLLRLWRLYEHNKTNPRLTIRVIDTAGVVVEQWPKTK